MDAGSDAGSQVRCRFRSHPPRKKITISDVMVYSTYIPRCRCRFQFFVLVPGVGADAGSMYFFLCADSGASMKSYYWYWCRCRILVPMEILLLEPVTVWVKLQPVVPVSVPIFCWGTGADAGLILIWHLGVWSREWSETKIDHWFFRNFAYL